MTVAAITAAVPSRFHLLRECLDSVRVQTVPVAQHVVVVDYVRAGAARTFNAAARAADADWLLPVSDDDVCYPRLVERLLAHADDADVVYAFADMRDWPDHSTNRFVINRPFRRDVLERQNYIPGGCTLIRKSLFDEVGGYPEDRPDDEDYGLWLRLLAVDARFACVPELLWYYRRHDKQKQAELHGQAR